MFVVSEFDECLLIAVIYMCYVIVLGAFAVYLEPWHADIFEFLELKINHGKVWDVTTWFHYYHLVMTLALS